MYKYILILVVITGALIRLVNLTPFKIFPDSYQSLIVARNIIHYGSVTGFLGEHGVFYPPYIIWSRPGYPILIDLLSFITGNAELSSRIISLSSGVLAIVLAYFLLKSVFNSKTTAVAGAGLLAVSFNHTIWSGFIMTETLGVLLLIILFWVLSETHKKRARPQNILDIFSGVILSLAIMTRFEYILLTIPVLFLITTGRKRFVRLVNFAAGLFISLSIFYFLLFPSNTIGEIFVQLKGVLIRATIAIGIITTSAASFFIIPKWFKSRITELFPNLLRTFVLGLPIYIVLQFLLPVPQIYPAFSMFFLHDPAIIFFSIYGYFIMLEKGDFQKTAYISFLSCLLLLFVYQKINPSMERYLTHTLPFLLIPASYGLVRFLKISNKYFFLKLVVLLIFTYQLFVSFYGLRSWSDGSWSRTNYYDLASAKVSSLAEKNSVLLVSFVEPYFLNTGISTQGVDDKPPFIHLDQKYDNYTLFIVNDMGMREVYPKFAGLLDSKLKAYKNKEFKVNEVFHYLADVKAEKYPVQVYKIKVGELRKFVNN